MELAQVTERLLAAQAPFPSDLLLPPAPVSQLTPPQPSPPQFQPQKQIEANETPSNSLKTMLEQEENDATADLLAALAKAVSGETSNGNNSPSTTTSSSLPDAIVSRFPALPDITVLGPMMPKIARAVGLGAGLALTVPAIASFLQRKQSDGEMPLPLEGGKIAQPTPQKTPVAVGSPKEQSNASSGWFSWLNWLFADDEEAPPAVASTSKNISVADGLVAQQSVSIPPPSPPPGELPSQPSIGSSSVPPPPPPSASAGQVLWRRKEFEVEENVNDGGGPVLWRRKEESGEPSTSKPTDLWRMPLESLKGGSREVESNQLEAEKKVVVEDRRGAIRGEAVGGRGLGSRVGPKVSESALDNAEP